MSKEEIRNDEQADEESNVRFGVILKGKMADAFLNERRKTLAQSATLARQMIKEGLERRGYTDLEDEVSWGGKRR